LRKFRFRFLDYNQKTAKENCLNFVTEMSRYFNVEEINRQSQEIKLSNPSLTNKSTMNQQIDDSCKLMTNFSNNESVCLKDMAKVFTYKKNRRFLV
jgi:hypothetical protein